MSEIVTTDIALATALISSGNKLVDVKSAGYSQAEFHIEEQQGGNLKEDIINFQNRNLKVDAMTLFENHKSLKSRASDALRNQY